MKNPSVNSIVERLELHAVCIAPIGSRSGEERWEAAKALREAATIISELQAQVEREKGEAETYARWWREQRERALTAESSLSRIKAETIEECAAFLAREYPENVSTNAFCAAIRSLGSTGGGDAEEGSTQKEGLGMNETSVLSESSVLDALAAYDKRMQEIGACGESPKCPVCGRENFLAPAGYEAACGRRVGWGDAPGVLFPNPEEWRERVGMARACKAALSDFTRVVEETGVLQKETQRRKRASGHD